MYAQGHLAILKGNLLPEGAVAKITSPEEPGDDRHGSTMSSPGSKPSWKFAFNASSASKGTVLDNF